MKIDNLIDSAKKNLKKSYHIEPDTGLTGIAKQGKQIPPVASWSPQRMFEMDLTIKSNGEWWHEGSQFTRQKLVDMFASILWCEIDETTQEKLYFLQTPTEKAKITVDDVPLMVTEVHHFHEQELDWLQFTTSTGDVINASAKHPIFMKPFITNGYRDDQDTQQSRAYIHVRENLTAFINRNTFFHLIDIGKLVESESSTTLQLKSGGETFNLES